ncbi:MAG: hypothetical protein UX51_C0004G0001 [Candidatus Azambacteria bacterium GW2011_GWF2_46_32]|uniref:Uncharacterized protein n=2 Tax=Candidatus Azamiibacteriota TaxID=1752741 RepID=A0A0G1QD92_9BACT|nr:MAG: hypothetical protein UX51_C0004G0001 [Candidatus Azambacteria bacterium GW2011_GWF2_46_32]KKU42969.1 MAG: hypothetical protein UX56_C0001G0004 [Candidatus Azambacteria bacterium GW2011_GWD2_46_48]
MANRHSVRVSGWSNSRTVIEQDGKVMLEIALTHNHCPTCASRVRHVTEALSRRNVQYTWAYPPDSSGSFIAVAAPGDGLSVEKYLSGLLDLNISR